MVLRLSELRNNKFWNNQNCLTLAETLLILQGCIAQSRETEKRGFQGHYDKVYPHSHHFLLYTLCDVRCEEFHSGYIFRLRLLPSPITLGDGDFLFYETELICPIQRFLSIGISVYNARVRMDEPSASLLSLNTMLSSYMDTLLTVSLSASFCLMETDLPLSTYILLMCVSMWWWGVGAQIYFLSQDYGKANAHHSPVILLYSSEFSALKY